LLRGPNREPQRRGGDPSAMIAELYDLDPTVVEAAIRFELIQAAPAA
jgi:hypothetical protein